jgi:hypothetical protein
MRNNFNLADVPSVQATDLDFVIQLLIERGQGLALIRGLRENEIREIEDRIWAEFDGSNDARLAVALRFRALLSVFASRRLKALLLERGYRLLMAVGAEVASLPLNVRFGFNSQRLLLALEAATSAWRPVPNELSADRLAA